MTNDTMRCWAEIDTGALIHNMKHAKKLTGKRIMCVIKGDAHGHGAVECAKVFEANGADAFAVACLSEAMILREAGITLPILILGWTPTECADILWWSESFYLRVRLPRHGPGRELHSPEGYAHRAFLR